MMDFEGEAQAIVEKLKGMRLWEIGKYLIARGFRKYYGDNNNQYFMSETLVVKTPLIVGRKPRFGQHIAPTINFWIKDKRFVVQPRCDIENAEKAFDEILKLPDIDNWKDCAERNCGWYLGRPVIFDW